MLPLFLLLLFVLFGRRIYAVLLIVFNYGHCRRIAGFCFSLNFGNNCGISLLRMSFLRSFHTFFSHFDHLTNSFTKNTADINFLYFRLQDYPTNFRLYQILNRDTDSPRNVLHRSILEHNLNADSVLLKKLIN